MADVTAPATVGNALTARIEAGELSHDPGQMAVALALDDLITRLTAVPKRRWLAGLSRVSALGGPYVFLRNLYFLKLGCHVP